MYEHCLIRAEDAGSIEGHALAQPLGKDRMHARMQPVWKIGQKLKLKLSHAWEAKALKLPLGGQSPPMHWP